MTPENFFRLTSFAVMSIDVTTNNIANIPAAAAVGSNVYLKDQYRAIGSGVLPGVAINNDTSNCPKETIKAKIDPAITPLLILGKVTFLKACKGLAPKLLAACSRFKSKLNKDAETVPIT